MSRAGSSWITGPRSGASLTALNHGSCFCARITCGWLPLTGPIDRLPVTSWANKRSTARRFSGRNASAFCSRTSLISSAVAPVAFSSASTDVDDTSACSSARWTAFRTSVRRSIFTRGGDTCIGRDLARPRREKVMPGIAIDWTVLEAAFESHAPDVKSYLNKRTGEVATTGDGAPDTERARFKTVDWIEVEPVPSREQYRMMER